MSHLIIFDLDGTLAATTDVDTDCFVRSFNDAVGIRNFPVGHEHYHHTTDGGIADEIFRAQLGRAGTSEEVAAVKDTMASLLNAQAQASPERFGEVPGAGKLLHDLRKRSLYKIAIATGSWLICARLKFKLAALDVEGLPIATSDDAIDRIAIVQLAQQRAAQYYSGASFDKITLVGDGLWDLETAQSLGFHFIGVAFENERAYLERAGAKWVFETLNDIDSFLRACQG